MRLRIPTLKIPQLRRITGIAGNYKNSPPNRESVDFYLKKSYWDRKRDGDPLYLPDIKKKKRKSLLAKMKRCKKGSGKAFKLFKESFK